MKKLLIILTLLFVSCQQGYAANGKMVAHFEKLESKREKDMKKVCAKGDLDKMTDREAVKCLGAHIKLLEASMQVHYEYYINTLNLLDLFYTGDLKNYRD